MLDVFGWFESLRDIKQVDTIIVDIVQMLWVWVNSLSLNQRLILAVSIVVALCIMKWLLKMLRRAFSKLRLRVRRKFIPKKVDLHLDREQRDR